jgi:uncharacterized protein (DUF1015 family)
MATVLPFRALRPPNELVEKVSCPPYDVPSEKEARELAADNPSSLLRVKRPEIEFGVGTDPHAEAVYERAATNFAKFRREGWLVQDATPAYFVYRLQMGKHAQTGIVGVCAVDEYDNGTIKKHEKTRQDKEDDRTRHIIVTKSQYGPVLMTYRNSPSLTKVMNDVMKGDPEYELTDEHKVVHTVWRVDAEDERAAKIQKEFERVPNLYIGDGHHRAKSASRARAELSQYSHHSTGKAGYDTFLSVLFPASQLQILPYNRVVLTLHGRHAEDVLKDIRARFTVETLDEPIAPPKGSFTVYLGGRWYGIRPKQPPPDDPIEALDVSICHRELLGPVFGIKDVRTDPNLDFVGGIRTPAELKERADARGGAAILLHPTSVEDVLRVSDAGGIMPPKSTWFEPKLRSGLFINVF